MATTGVIQKRQHRTKNEFSSCSQVLEILGKSQKDFSMEDLTSKTNKEAYDRSSRNLRNAHCQILDNTNRAILDTEMGRYKLKHALIENLPFHSNLAYSLGRFSAFNAKSSKKTTRRDICIMAQ